MGSTSDLARKLRELENKYDSQFVEVFEAIYKLMEPLPLGKKRRIGFVVDEPSAD
jgi:hypothetical protein